jgi:succinate dehydrogenase/fumarate reductase cytochrome b subunit
MTETNRATASPPVPLPAPALRAIAPLAALAYPGLIWCGPRLSPAFLAVALAVPVIGLIAAHRIGLAGASPVARVAAHLAVAAPPLFSMLGGWLDFQRAVPFGSVGLWIPLWSSLIIAALVDRRRPPARAAPRSRRLAAAHAISAAAIALFAAAHLVNHLGGLLGGDVHVAIMSALRGVYRHRLIEPLLLAAVAFQIATGLWLLGRKLARPARWFDTLQTATGFYVMVFFLSHLGAVLRARLLRHRDTDWTWLAGGELLSDPWSARLVPYYFLAVIALATHGACGLRVVLLGHGISPARGAALVGLAAAAATVASALIMLGLFRA